MAELIRLGCVHISETFNDYPGLLDNPRSCKAFKAVSGIRLDESGLNLCTGICPIDIRPVDFYSKLSSKPFALAIAGEIWARLEYESPEFYLYGNICDESDVLKAYNKALMVEREIKRVSREIVRKGGTPTVKPLLKYSSGEMCEDDHTIILLYLEKSERCFVVLKEGETIELMFEGSLEELKRSAYESQLKIASMVKQSQEYDAAYQKLYDKAIDDNLVKFWVRDRVAFMNEKQREGWQHRILREFVPTVDQVQAYLHESQNVDFKA